MKAGCTLAAPAAVCDADGGDGICQGDVLAQRLSGEILV